MILIPLTITSLHKNYKFLLNKAIDRFIQFFYFLYIARFDCFYKAVLDVILQNHLSGIVDRRFHCRKLNQHLAAVTAILHHPLDRLHMSDHAGEAV